MTPLAPSLDRKGLDLWIHAGVMSQAAYGNASAWIRATGNAGWDISGFLDPGAGFQGGWTWSDQLDALEIACCGSSELRDFTLDATSWIPNRWSELPSKWWVSYGMVKGPRRAWPDIVALFERFDPSHVFWCGHSKGGGEAELGHAATITRGMTSSCVAIEPPRVFRRGARDAYRVELTRDGCRCDVVINTSNGYRDAVTAYPRTLKHGGDLRVLGETTIYSGQGALEQWHRYKRGDREGWRPLRRVQGRFGAHSITGVIEHMESLAG